MASAAVPELGREHAARAQRFAVGFERLVDHGEAVALAQAAAEVRNMRPILHPLWQLVRAEIGRGFEEAGRVQGRQGLPAAQGG